MRFQSEKGHAFRGLHYRDRAFIIPNPWDAGTARLLAGLGFEALATTSAGYAFSCGQADNTIDRPRMLAHLRDIASATDLPISADLGNGFGDDPDTVAETIRLAAATGIVGCSIEDAAPRRSNPVYDIGLAVERMRAAVEAVRSLDFPFMLTARAENYLLGRRDLEDTVRRLQAYQDAGADVLYAPGVEEREEISVLVRAVDRPLNVVMGLAGPAISLAELARLGVKRVSIGSALSRAAFGAVLRAAHEMRDSGTFAFAADAVSFREINAVFESDDRRVGG
jgi:2-methylisocitrate lyase-like PEP mutase family enzyme